MCIRDRLEAHARPKVGDYGIPKGKHFYVRGLTKTRQNRGNTSGFLTGQSVAKDSRSFFYLRKLSDLDKEALKISDTILTKAEYIFSQELKK